VRFALLLLICLVAGCVYDPYGPYYATLVYGGGTVIIGGQQYWGHPWHGGWWHWHPGPYHGYWHWHPHRP
jgi:hypothetical protein